MDVGWFERRGRRRRPELLRMKRPIAKAKRSVFRMKRSVSARGRTSPLFCIENDGSGVCGYDRAICGIMDGMKLKLVLLAAVAIGMAPFFVGRTVAACATCAD